MINQHCRCILVSITAKVFSKYPDCREKGNGSVMQDLMQFLAWLETWLEKIDK